MRRARDRHFLRRQARVIDFTDIRRDLAIGIFHVLAIIRMACGASFPLPIISLPRRRIRPRNGGARPILHRMPAPARSAQMPGRRRGAPPRPAAARAPRGRDGGRDWLRYLYFAEGRC
ncbi:hypothetical protein WS83_00280 [Burkholderia sp. MSMB2042]|nr:hypothetical protein WS78_22145 [Burkholderia savannae]KVG37087.1 hypothetical protein WS77_22835 [Burkholderia sp. MSMB0265]KVG77713.1 hypothetical protein WS81_18100 [Burkholderia sp. MSMB2040]KVG94145.1 hypothetical protein WS83_00280 [Burkholderia sp. MSMB2042]KVG97631.1 hypothetical protein WS82_27905 [Burkholderia sp. MSMB2041]KVK84318.1 hypothetical protein WS91_05030 [Burkholderia sp. MSMB1498]